MRTKRILSFLFAVLIAFALSGNALAAAFADVPESHAYKAEIDFCQAKGYIQGVSDTAFKPDLELTRGQLAVIWCRMLFLHEVNHSFTDLPRLNHYYDTAAIVMNSLGILNGTSETKFSPNAFVTREQLAMITARTLNLGVANENDYQAYNDHASISEWARDGISACLNADVLTGLYDDDNLMPQKPVTRAEICKLIYNISLPAFTVTIAELTGGTITAFPSIARAGTVITLIIDPDTGKQLKAGTLKFNDNEVTGTTFIMPAEDVMVTAEFEDIPKALESIEVTTPPAKNAYTVGEILDLAEMVVTASYTDDTSAPVTGYTTSPLAGSTLDSAGTVTVTVTYTEDDVTKTDTFDVTVTAAPG